ncbi:MAG: DNA-directed RNA polymerase subunit alpha, partial [Patescibacteria group bacterium]
MNHKIPLPQKPKIIKKGENRAVFEIDGCYPGYGLSLGNAFRRVLLSSLPGAAISAVKIKGVSHEFSTIPYVAEDVIHLILNLKQIRFRMHAPEALPLKVDLKVVGEKEVKAKDIKLSAELEIINKDTHIATLTDKKAKLEMEIEIQGGLGYVP